MAEKNPDEGFRFPPPPPPQSGPPPIFRGAPPAVPPFVKMESARPKLPVALEESPEPPKQQRPPAPPKSRADEDKERMLELERRLQDEREKVLRLSLKAQEEKAVAARVETSLHEIQDRLRRQKRDSEQEETRLKLEGRIQELENRLVQERETWVTTLKGQLHKSENEDRDIESQFMARIQELERRWLEEKAQWQRQSSIKDDELRRGREAQEKLAALQRENEKTTDAHERLKESAEQSRSRIAELEARLRGAMDREREYFQIKAEAERARDQVGMLQEKLERECSAIRGRSKEKEERLISDIQRLQADLGGLSQKLRVEYDAELRHAKAQHEAELTALRDGMGAELKKTKAQADVAAAALQRMRAVGSALEKQVAALRMQSSESVKVKEELQRVNERYRAEFLVLQRKWQDRESEIRNQAEGVLSQRFEAEKIKLKVRAQEEIQDRIVKLQAQLRKEGEAELTQKEKIIRAEMERELAERARRIQADLSEMRRKLESEIERKSADGERRENDWKEKLLSREADLAGLRSELDQLRGRMNGLEEEKARAVRERLETEKALAAEREKCRYAEKSAADAESRALQAARKAEAVQSERVSLESQMVGGEGRISELQRQLEALRAAAHGAEAARESQQAESRQLRETIERLESEHAVQKESWRRQIELVKNDAQERLKRAEFVDLAAPPPVPKEGGPGVADRLKGMFGGKTGDAT